MEIKAQEALKQMGFDTSRPQRGAVLVRVGTCRIRWYAFRYRIGDGHVITRRGRLHVAERQANTGLWIFSVAPDRISE